MLGRPLVPLLLTVWWGCASPHVLVTVDDPDEIATDAVRLQIGEELGAGLDIDLGGNGFPVSVVLTGEPPGRRSIFIDALASDGEVTGRGFASVDLRSSRGSTALVFLFQPCEGEDFAGSDEDIDPRCDDAIFCNGTEICLGGVCNRKDPPCVPVIDCVQMTCREEDDLCTVSVHHELCAPQDGPEGPIATYCDTAVGCVPGDPCADDPDCQDASVCNGAERCVGGRCTGGLPPAVDDDNPCTNDFCAEGTGPTNRPVEAGTPCDLAGVGDGVCIERNCQATACGDGYRDPADGEECDWGVNNSDKVPNACRSDCTLPTCGDAVADDGETCDDGNALDSDDCLSTCVLNVCGDGIRNLLEEECDDGNTVEEDPCRNNCRANTCGDGFLNPLAEICDDSNRSNLDTCLATCKPNLCGDGFLNFLIEACDDGNTNSGDGCTADCAKTEVCGDSVIDVGEACDDGNTNPVDACDACGLNLWSREIVVGTGQDNRKPLQMALSVCEGLAVTPDGDLYFSDQIDHRIWRLDNTVGRLVRVAGDGTSGYRGDFGPAYAAAFNTPYGLALSGVGELYVADWSNSIVREIGPDQIIRPFAGFAVPSVIGDGVPAVWSGVWTAADVAIGIDGDVFFSDANANCVRRVDAAGILTTAAGFCVMAAGGYGGDGGPATAATLSFPMGIAVDEAGDLYISDALNNRVRKVDYSGGTGFISTVAGTGVWGFTCDDCPAVSSQINHAYDITVDGLGNLYISECWGQRLRKVDPGGTITTIAGTGTAGFDGDGGPAVGAQLYNPRAVEVDHQGRVFIGDWGSHRIRMIDTDGTIETIIGSGEETFPEVYATDVRPVHWPQGTALQAPNRVAIGNDDNLYIADTFHHRVLEVTTSGIVTLVAGTGTAGYNGDYIPATGAALYRPYGLAVDSTGNVFVADTYNHRVRKADATGVITTVAGTGDAGFNGDGIAATSAQLNEPYGVAVDSGDNVFIADRRNSRIRRVDAGSGLITTVADAATPGLYNPTDVAIDDDDDLYIADFWNNRIRRRTPDGVFTVVAGTGIGTFGGDGGLAVEADISGPFGLTVANDTVYFADYFNRRVRKVDLSTGIISTVAGTGYVDSKLLHDWVPATSVGLTYPGGVAVDSLGNLFIADSYIDYGIQPVDTAYRVRKVHPSGIISTAVGAVEHPTDGPFAIADLGTPAALIALPAIDGWLVTETAAGRVRAVGENRRVVETVAGYPEALSETMGPVFARGSRLLGGVCGIAYDEASQTVFLAESKAHVIRRLFLTDPADPNTWVIDTLAGQEDEAGHLDGAAPLFDGPSGLTFDAGTRTLYVTETGNHVVRAIDVDNATATTVAGTPRTRGFYGEDVAARSALFDAPQAVALAGDGSLYIADTRNHRVRRVDPTGTVATVIGDGQPASGGDGSPARHFPVDTPRGVAVDAYGNLYVTSGTAVRVVKPGEDAVATGDDEVLTIYGAEPRNTFPEAVTTCLSGILVDDEIVVVTDLCQGLLLRLSRNRLNP